MDAAGLERRPSKFSGRITQPARVIVDPRVRRAVRGWIPLRWIDSQDQTLRQRQQVAVDEMRKRYCLQTSVMYLGIVLAAHIAISLSDVSPDIKPLPAKWINARARPNPNSILEILWVQIANYSLAAARLIESGLLKPAEATFRCVMEYCWLVLVLGARQDLMREYVGGQDAETAARNWRRHFTMANINRALGEIESGLGGSQSTLTDERAFFYRLYSSSVHGAFDSALWGSWVESADDETRVRRALLGAPSREGADLAALLSAVLLYTTNKLYKIFTHIHSFDSSVSEVWYTAEQVYAGYYRAVGLLIDETNPAVHRASHTK